MPNISTKRSHSRGTVSSSRTSQKSSKNSSKTMKISKFFAKKESDEDLSDSPYKNCLSDVKSAKLNDSDLDDFKTPQALNKVSKLTQVKKEKNVKKRKKSVQVPLHKFFEDNFKHSDCNPDQLQMALALSESSYEAENPNSQEKKESFRKAFEKYGFGYSKSKVSVEIKKETSKNRKSRYRYVTPILKIRTQEEREQLISSKVSLILAQNSQKPVGRPVESPVDLFSPSLKKFVGWKIVQLNRFELGELNKEGVFYVSGLGIEPSPASCGCLLKDWRRIPGREPTPERNTAEGGEIMSPIVEVVDSTETTKFPILGGSTPINVDNEIEEITSPTMGSLVSPRIEAAVVNFPKNDAEGTKIITPKSVRSISPEIISSGDSVIEITSPVLGATKNEFASPSKYRLSPDIREHVGSGDFNDTIIVTPPKEIVKSPIKRGGSAKIGLSSSNRSNPKRSFECVSPDLFESDDECRSPNKSRTRSSNNSLILGCSKPRLSLSTAEEMECFDLTQSDEEENSFHLRLSGPEDSIDQRSDLNVTEYVNTLLTQHKEQKFEKISTSGEDLSQESVSLCDEELNYSSVFGTPHPKNVYLSDEELEDERNKSPQLSPMLEERIKSKRKISQQESFNSSPDRVSSNVTPMANYDQMDALKLSLFVERKTPQKPLEDSFNADQFTPMANYDKMDTLKLSPLVEDVPLEERIKSKRKTSQQPLEDSFNAVLEQISSIETPNKSENGTFVINTSNVTPMANYDAMDALKLSPFVERKTPQRPLEDSFNADQFFSNVTPMANYDKMDTLKLSPIVEDVPLEERIKSKRKTSQQPLEDSFNAVLEQISSIETPNKSENGTFVIKTSNVTPMANYDEMDTPKIVKELDKFGLKPLKRQKGAKLLRYIYESTHPVVEDDNGKVLKKRRTRLEYPQSGGVIIGDLGEEEDLIFERTQSKKIPSCRVPLHIVWFNLVMSNPKIRENILLYEPLQLEILHAMIKEQGFKFNIQDLLQFLDRKCITIRTAQGSHHGKNVKSVKAS